METSFVTENRGFLTLSSGVARFYGLLLLFIAGITAVGMVVSVVTGLPTSDGAKQSFWLTGLSRLPALVLGGLLALALAEFIQYVMGREGEPKWILRHADKILFIHAACIALVSASLVRRTMADGWLSDFSNLISFLLAMIHILGQPLILIGVGITLRKILPIIQESKTLV